MFEDLVEAVRKRGSESGSTNTPRSDGGTAVSRHQGSAAFIEDAIDPDSNRLVDVFDDPENASIASKHVSQQLTLDPATIRDLVAEYEQAGIGPDEFVATQGFVTESLVSAAFDHLRDQLDADALDTLDSVEAELREGLDTTQFVTRTGVDAYATSEGVGEAGAHGGDGFDFHDVLHHIGTPLFMLDPAGEIIAWNGALEELTGLSEAEAKEMEMASMAFYADGRRGMTLADKVLDAPEQTHTEYDVPKVEDADFTLYRDTSVMTDHNGNERHISFSAAPIYDGDEVVAVVEMIQDRTEEAERHEEVTRLVEEVKSTMGALQNGELGARASFDREHGKAHVDDALFEVVGSLNEMAEQVERLTLKVDEQAQELASTIDQTAASAETVEARVADQSESLGKAAENIQDISAGMEEVAATSSEVASAANRAMDAAENGSEAGEAVKDVTDDLTETSDDLVGSVTDLESQMDQVSEIVEVIADVAEQTNMLALNANIEAARAGESGSGFAVVADEVKTLANETSDHASEISSSISKIQNQATETAEMVETSHEQVEHAEAEIQEALDSLNEISDAVEEATSGIQEVANANDDQAGAIEDITSMVENAQDHAEEAESATKQIVASTEKQQDAVDALTDRVKDLTDSE